MDNSGQQILVSCSDIKHKIKYERKHKEYTHFRVVFTRVSSNKRKRHGKKNCKQTNQFPEVILTVLSESIYPLGRGKTSSLQKCSSANSSHHGGTNSSTSSWTDVTERRGKEDAVYRGEETMKANFFWFDNVNWPP